MNILIICLFYQSMTVNNALVIDDPLSLEGKLREGYPTPKPLPYVAGLYEVEELFCSGVLISDKHILTAAECLRKFFNTSLTDFMDYHAKLGSDYLYEAGWSYYFEAVEIHSKFDFKRGGTNNNIGLITLEIPNYKGKIRNWIQWENRRIMMGENHYLMGWGKGRKNLPGIVQALLFAGVSLINTRDECRPISTKKYIDHKKLICAKLNKKKGSYETNFKMENFDLGAPLVNANSKLEGVLCLFKPSERLKKYGVFIDIRAYDKWITEVKKEINNRPDCETNYRIARPEDIFKEVNFKELVGIEEETGSGESVKHEAPIEDTIMNESVREEPEMHKSVKEEATIHGSEDQKSVMQQ